MWCQIFCLSCKPGSKMKHYFETNLEKKKKKKNNKISFQQGIATTLNLVSLSTIFFMAGKINYSIYMLLIRNMKQIVRFFKLKQFLEMENA